MPDLSRLETELREHHPESWVRHHLDSFAAAYFTVFEPADVARHLGLIRALDDEHLVFAQARPAGAAGDEADPDRDRWWVEIVGYDAFQFLSTACNLLAVHGLAIVEGSVFTSQPPPPGPGAAAAARRFPGRPGIGIGIGIGAGAGSRPSRPRDKGQEPDRRRKIVDRFLVRRAGSAVARDPAPAPAPDWQAFEAELQALARLLRTGHHDEVHHRLIGPLAAVLGRQRGEEPPLEPLELVIDPEADPAATVVRLAARDSFGFLSLMASALALCGIMIVQADIRTAERDDRIDDTLWVTDRGGHKITAEGRLRELRLSLILIEHFSSRLHRATNPEAALVHFSRFATETMARPAWAEQFAALDRPAVLDALVRVLGESDFLWEDYLQTRPEDLLPMVGNPAEWRRRDPGALAAELSAALAEAQGDEERVRALRRFKDRSVFRAGFRAILETAPPEMLSEELSDAAEVLVKAAYTVAADAPGARLPLPLRAGGRIAPAALFALGKFGGRELGFASDLELILVYDDRPVVAAPDTASAGAHFDNLVAGLRRLLAGRQGSTFELDFRLRPYGRAGAPATSMSAFADYYRGDGPAWSYERQALIKLRPIVGDPDLTDAILALRDRFVYGPEPFDLAGCRRMRALQVEQRVQPGRVNAKFSPGALVDVEYFVQSLQIAHGGRDPSVRTPNTQRAIAALFRSGKLGADEVETLQTGYRFFRALVDALRVVHGHAQDLTVPPAGTEEFVLLARRMHLPDPAALEAGLAQNLGRMQALLSRQEAFLGPA
jgi:glutamate-ammonia-ligase adenylyltransferase